MLHLTKILLTLILPFFLLTTLYPARTFALNETSYIRNIAAVNADCESANIDKNNCGIVRYLLIFINAMSGLVGVVVIIMIIIGGIQYSSAGSDPQKVQAAKSKITNAVLALAMFIFMFSFLQWIVPGGIF